MIPLYDQLDAIGAKLRGIAHLIEIQRHHDPPIDLDSINYGLGRILSEMSDELKRLAVSTDPCAAQDGKKKKSRKT